MPQFSRTDRLSEQVKHELYDIIRSLKDPRIPQMFTVTYAQVTNDLRHAKVGVSAIGTEEEQQAFVKALKGAAGHVRRELGQRIDARYVPEVHFSLDPSIERSIHIQQKLREIEQQETKDDE